MPKSIALAKKIGKKAINAGGDFIASKVMLQPSLDKARGVDADIKRTALLRRRESVKNDKSMGY